jgi:hypothetical protein
MEFKLLGMKLRLEVIVICVALGFILGGHLLCGCSRVSMKEAMTTMGTALNHQNNKDMYNSWTSKSNKYAASMNYVDERKKYSAYKGTKVPLPEGEMCMFHDNEFKPECCPSTYSSSTGCACITSDQVKYLNERGGNRTIKPAEY